MGSGSESGPPPRSALLSAQSEHLGAAGRKLGVLEGWRDRCVVYQCFVFLNINVYGKE